MQLILNILISFFPYLIISYGFMLIFCSTKFFHITHAIAFTFGAYFFFFFFIQLSFVFFIAVLLAIFTSLLIIIILELIIYRPSRKINIPSWQLLVVSLGAYVALQNVISLIWGDNIQIIRNWPVSTGHEFFGAYITNVQVFSIVISIILLLVTRLFLGKTKMGKKIKAISENKELSNHFGISSNRGIIWSFAIGSALAAFAGILIAADRNMTPTMGFDWLLYGVIAMIIGGVGKLRHLILGALLLASAQHLAAYYIGSKWMDTTAFIILIIFLAWKPYGFSGQKLRKAEI